ncbi:lytic transglycosylase domain-containing protein [Aureivirga sp. CE67]|uniref:lytic transglycosylase domain-containing protein n=1 Tax=Aureivirga sp. CE67 TaxID=1788983 RepID=UPI0018CAC02A|nr:lytic transglycosylase domain-containing protein [Aureivirga sp. CE67]
MRRLIVTLLFLGTISIYAQKDSTNVVSKSSDQILDSVSVSKDSLALAKNDSIQNAILRKEGFKTAAQIDSLWLVEMYKSSLYDTVPFLIKDTEMMQFEEKLLTKEVLKERLAHLNSQTPFKIEYNPILENLINNYLKRRKRSLSKVMERAQYYFPMFEEHLDKYDLPLEIKYLAIVESALQPRIKSWAGAKGLWQFMYQTGKQYDLKVSSYVDERSDPIRATEAACQYLEDLYKIFGEWDLALAAYNSGPGNVTKAIRRSGGHRNYWNIRNYLPRETAGYVPAFYATLYLFEYKEEHDLFAASNKVAFFETDTVQVKRFISFEQIEKKVDVDIDLIRYLNPQYRLEIIPYVKDKEYVLTLPKDAIARFVENEAEIYAYIDAEEAKQEKPLPKYTEMGNRIRYKVKSGDYLGKIAKKYRVSVRKIKQWNNLRSNNLRIGQRLTIYPRNY